MAEMFRTGYVGGAVPEAIDWMVEKSEGAQSICVPFAGIGRSIVAMARPDTTIESWDTMHYARCLFDGVFKASEIETNVDGIHYRKGFAYENRPYKHLDDRCAGFIDWVAQEGTPFDKACLGSAMTRSTLMGRMMNWHSNVEQLYARYLRQKEYNKDWLSQPGTLVHHEGDFFAGYEEVHSTAEALGAWAYDLVEIDPPKVVNYSDVYSLHFQRFNDCLTGGKGPKLPKWNRRNAMGLYRKAMQVKAPRIIFMYTSRVLPRVEDVERMLALHGTIKEKQEFFHSGKTDYGFYLERS